MNTKNTSNLRKILNGYFYAALFASTNLRGEPLDENYTIENIRFGSLLRQSRIVKNFVNGIDREDLNFYLNSFDYQSLGHNFWLTRNGHGAGFWDRGLGSLGRRLTNSAHIWGEATMIEDEGAGKIDIY